MTPAQIPSQQAALRGEPSYVWRTGQERRLGMVRSAAGKYLTGRVLENGCGIGAYLNRLAESAQLAVGIEIEFQRAVQAASGRGLAVCGAGENLPFPNDWFDFILSHEVLEHMQDDRQAVAEMIRVLRPGGRLAVFVPNRGYPFETHGIYWKGKYHFGNIPLVNYLPRGWRDRLAPHVRIYSRSDLDRLFVGLPVRLVKTTVIFGAYDNIIARNPRLGNLLRSILQSFEKTPLCGMGLSHFWVVEKTAL